MATKTVHRAWLLMATVLSAQIRGGSWFWFPALAASAGCVSSPMLQTARTVDEGTFRYSFGLHGGMAWRQTWATSPWRATWWTEPYPAVEVSGRYGLGSRVDVGVRTGSHTALLFDVKTMLLRSNAIDVSLANGIGVVSASSGDVVGYPAIAVSTTAFLGLNLTERVTILIAPRMLVRVQLLETGGGLGVAIRLADWLIIVPEVNAGHDDPSEWFDAPLTIQGGVGLHFGGARTP